MKELLKMTSKVFSNRFLSDFILGDINTEKYMLNKSTTTPPVGVRGLSEPIIQVGILSSEKIEFILNGTFVDNNGNSFTGRQIAQIQNNSILLNSNLYDEINFESVSENASFDLIDVVIGINFHW